ncbi:MAG: ATP-binding protein [Anaerolineales bacterium]|nr:ATP-binding protein [Anaerolineales bacterium]
MDSATLRIEGQYDQLQSVRDLINQAAENAGFSSKECYACQLAVSEAVENIIRHGYGREVENKIQVTVSTEPGVLNVELTDDAPPFNPTNNRKERQWSIDDPPIGGLGIEIIHSIMDDVEYSRESGRNHLSLQKKKRASSESTD